MVMYDRSAELPAYLSTDDYQAGDRLTDQPKTTTNFQTRLTVNIQKKKEKTTQKLKLKAFQFLHRTE